MQATASSPRVVFGMPAYDKPTQLVQTLESLLIQTYRDFALVIVDDKPSPAVQAVVDAYASDPRVHYEPNPKRLGMIANWQKAFARARQLYPGATYFAWVSDHDRWHPRWLEVLVEALDANPRAVVAYPQMQRVFPNLRRSVLRRFETVGIEGPLARLYAVSFGMTAGNSIYGLFRADRLEQAGVFRPVLAPDRQVLVALSLLGEFIHVRQVLWYREVAGIFSYGRQRRMFFPDGSPWHTYLPAHVQHFGVLLWDFGVRGRGRPSIGRPAGTGLALVHFALSTYRELMKRDAIWWRLIDQSPVGRWLGRKSAAADDEAADSADKPEEADKPDKAEAVTPAP
jgi:glycosyltransferase involved in cell wall biosynthesis